MRYTLLLTTIILLSTHETGFGQSLWKLSPSTTVFVSAAGDTSLAGLKAWMEASTPEFYYYSPAQLLAYYYGQSVKEYLLSKLKLYADISDRNFAWSHYFMYQYIRGFLGDDGAKAGMDTVIHFSYSRSDRLEAIRLLAEAGVFNYYDTLQSAAADKRSWQALMPAFALYAKAPTYVDRVKSMMLNFLKDNSLSWRDRSAVISAMEAIDSHFLAEALDTQFHLTNGELRSLYFDLLLRIDPSGAVRRSIYAIPLESDDHYRNSYIPSYPLINSGMYTTDYLKPPFIKFVKDWLTNESSTSIVHLHGMVFLTSFLPARFQSDVRVINMIDSLENTKSQVLSYAWLADKTFSSDLEGNLQAARESLMAGDSVGCARAIRSFQMKIDFVYKDASNLDPRNVTIEGWKFLYYNAQYILDRLPRIPASPVIASLNPSTAYAGGNGFSQNVRGKAFVATSVVLWNGSSRTTSFVADSVLQATILASDIASPGTASVAVVNPGYDTSNVLPFTVTQAASGLSVKLVNSAGTNLTGGSLQYYDGSWKDAVNNNDGTFKVNTTLKTVSLRITYEGASQTKSNVTVGYDVVTFQTVNALVKLQNSTGTPIDTGTVQYYYSSWQALGRTMNGVASKELLPGNYTFRMSYAAATLDKQQDIGANPTVVFTTVNAAVQLKNSAGTLIDQGTVQYYFSSWQNLGTTTNGLANKELLPGNYTFRMSYASATNDKQQNIGSNPTVVFQTVNAAVQLRNSQGALIDTGTVQYYFSSWQALGSTTNGVATKELLPGTYTFRMGYASATKDKQQNLGTNPTVVFNTVNASVQLRNSLGAFIDQGTVQYYFSSWKTLGSTTNGVAVKELLPGSYTFRMTYETVTNDKVQDISTNSTVSFSTVLCTVRVNNAQGQPVDGAQVSYYFSSWKSIGATVGGQITKELLPANLTFRETIGPATQNKVQNIGTNALVEFVVQ